MDITEFSLQNFRNYERLNLNLSKGINLFYGDNAQGKTNILEAIYLCATARSHRTRQEKELIQWTHDEACVRIKAQKKYGETTLFFKLTPFAKSICINQLPIRRLGELLGTLYVVMFSPEELRLVKNSPKERRRFIDMELCQLDRNYYQMLKSYQKVLKQRNMTLKMQNVTMLDIWDEQLIGYAQNIIQRRIKFIKQINALVQNIHGRITNYQETLEIHYLPSAPLETFEKQFLEHRDKDILRQGTNLGPHRDDIQFLINDKDAKLYASQGQQRTIVLALKLAELELIKASIGESPILLLDDVLSELDEKRQQYLFEYTKDTQTLVTCAENPLKKYQWSIKQFYHVTDNQVFLQNIPN